MQLQSTANVGVDGIKVLIYGKSGAGKTTALAGAPNPVILNSEKGLLSLRKHNLPYTNINTIAELKQAYTWLSTNPQAKQFKTVALDSLSDIGEIVLASEMANTTNGQKAYGEMAKKMADIIRDFRKLQGVNVIFICKEEYDKDNSTGNMIFKPSFPGNKFSQDLPYFFDEVWRLEVHTNPQTQETYRVIRTQSDFACIAKSRIGLPNIQYDVNQPIHLGSIFQQALSGA